MFICLTSYSQLLKESDVIFSKFKAFSKVDTKLPNGELIKEGEGNTKIGITNIGMYTYLSCESTVLKLPEQIFIISNINKEVQQGKLICDVEAYNGQDPNKKSLDLY